MEDVDAPSKRKTVFDASLQFTVKFQPLNLIPPAFVIILKFGWKSFANFYSVLQKLKQFGIIIRPPLQNIIHIGEKVIKRCYV